MKTLYKNALIYQEGKLITTDFVVNEQTFLSFGKDQNDIVDHVVDLNQHLVTPGLFDIHTHGALGYDFNIANFDEMKIIMNYYLENGVTSVFPTVMTDSVDVIHRQLKLLAKLQPLYPSIKGIHLEGPHLSMAYKGAQPASAIIKPSIDLFQSFLKDSNYLIKYTTIAPETEGALAFIAYCQAHGVEVTLGHSDATFEQTMKAIEQGAHSFTHMFNAMRPFNHHDPGIVGAALYSDNYVEMIMDGMHLAPDTVKMLKKVKSDDRLIIITDSIMAAGLPDGNYTLAGTPIYVKNKDARLVSNDARAGSTLNPYQAILNFSKFTDTPLEKTIKYMSENPARLFGFDHLFGKLAVGQLANFLVIDENKKLLEVYVEGQKVT